MAAAVAFLEEIGMERVAAYGRDLGVYLHKQLQELDDVEVLTPQDPALRAGITTFQFDRVPYKEVYRRLVTDHKLRCRIVSERGLDAIRVSTHIFNNRDECDQVVEAIRAMH